MDRLFRMAAANPPLIMISARHIHCSSYDHPNYYYYYYLERSKLIDALIFDSFDYCCMHIDHLRSFTNTAWQFGCCIYTISYRILNVWLYAIRAESVCLMGF